MSPVSFRPKRRSGVTIPPNWSNRSPPSAWAWMALACSWWTTDNVRRWSGRSASTTRRGSVCTPSTWPPAPNTAKPPSTNACRSEIEHVKKLFPKAELTGVADGSADNWTFLRQYTQDECLDFYHVAEYLPLAAKAVAPAARWSVLAWVEEQRHKLRHEKGYALKLNKQIQDLTDVGLSETAQEDLEKAKTYFANHHHQMKYAERVEAGLPIGSGVTEAACKTLVKMRMCRGGAKWKEHGAACVLCLRSLLYSDGRWDQFWAKVDRFGFPLALAA